MSLSTALNIAQSSLLNTGRQTSVVSRNVQESNNPDYTRRMAVLGSLAPGSRVVEIQRATNEQLFRQNLAALSAWSAQHELYEGLERLEIAIHGIDNQQSAAVAIGKLQEALQIYSGSPANRTAAENAIDAARQVVRTLNAATQSIQSFRAETDTQIAGAVGELNQLLAAFKDANDAVVKGTRAGADVSDALDRRDGLLKKISEYVPVTTLSRPNNDLVLITRDGVTLFETVARSVTFQPTTAYSPDISGNSIYIDGVPVGLGTGGNTDGFGKLAGLSQLRDGVAPKLQAQMDEIARGLITAFAEKSPPSSTAPGLFTLPGSSMPEDGKLVDGLAGVIRINPNFDYAVPGGEPEYLRDGGANGPEYIVNTDFDAGFARLLIEYGDRITTPMKFDGAAGLATTLSLSDFSTASVGWFQAIRKDASAAAQTKEALAVRTEEALSNATGVNVDSEMALLLELERSYEASARLIKAVDEMLAALLAAVR